MRFRHLPLFFCLFVFACNQAPQRPNIIYILADDLGYNEVGAYGQAKIKTPNLDQLAAQGMRFTQHYSGSPVCAPSRGTLLTGKHTGHAYIRDNYEMGGWGLNEPEGQLPLRDEEFTIAEMLKQQDYATGFVGKWGLGGPDSEGHPNNQGFDFFYGYLCQRVAHNYYPTHLWRNGEPDSLEGNPYFSAHQKIAEPMTSEDEYYKRFQGKQYAPDRMIDEAFDFIRQNKSRPFFLEFATPVPHVAIQVPKEALDPYRGAFDETPYLGQKGYLPHPYPLAGYAAMISRMDGDIGKLLALLDELGLADNTIVMFSSDNGTTFNGGTNAAFFESVGPLRGLKGSVFEGGIRVPMIARWPGKIAAGTVSDHPSAFWDVLPTIADIVGEDAPQNIDGVSFLPALLGQSNQPKHDHLYWEYHAYGGMQAVRTGDWKAVRLKIRENPDAPIQLFNLADDLGEKNDVAAQHPDIVAQIQSIMAARSTSPIEDWNFLPKKQ